MNTRCMLSMLAMLSCGSLPRRLRPAVRRAKLGLAEGALTTEQCEALFDSFAKTTICHRTNSAQNPYVIIKTDLNGCKSGHSHHAKDYLASNVPTDPNYDPTCKGLGCYPEGAPFDGSVRCCDGLAPDHLNICRRVPEPFTCDSAPDAVFKLTYIPVVSVVVAGVPAETPYILPAGASLVEECCLASFCAEGQPQQVSERFAQRAVPSEILSLSSSCVT